MHDERDKQHQKKAETHDYFMDNSSLSQNFLELLMFHFFNFNLKLFNQVQILHQITIYKSTCFKQQMCGLDGQFLLTKFFCQGF
jgi:hypothetical protein